MANLGSKPQALLSWHSTLPNSSSQLSLQVLQMELASFVWFSILISLQSHKSFACLVLFRWLPASFAVLRLDLVCARQPFYH